MNEYEKAKQPKQKTREWLAWVAQVNANYHDGGMSEADAEAAAGPEPIKHVEDAMEVNSRADLAELHAGGVLHTFHYEFPQAYARMLVNINR